VCWPLNWTLPGVRTAYLFFPLWLGYILVVDALVWRRTGASLWTRSRKGFVLLFILSVPAWWLFEIINWRTGNWNISAPARSPRSNITRSARCRSPPSCRPCSKPRNWCGRSAG